MNLCMMSCMIDDQPENIVKTAVLCGMHAIDWVTTHHASPEHLRRISEDAGLAIAAHTMLKQGFVNRLPEAMDEFKASLEDAVRLGAPLLMIPPFGRLNQVSLEDDRKAWIDYFSQALPLARQAGIALSMESTGKIDSPIVTVEEVLEVLTAVPGLRLTLDFGNMQTAEDAYDAFPRLKKYIVHMHLKDWKIYPRKQPDADLKRCGRYFASAVIGEGDLNLRKFWDSVDEDGRKLYVNLETSDFSGQGQAVQVLRRTADLLRNW